uniref:Chromophore lyase n=1 Tax=Palmaria palmata TaxID=2822 RepID=A0A1C9CH49_PALPL|nr:chromophore lyase [Palmaria palmata]AOM67687.1 chromophore lyase [Palmaria palmata]
MSSNTFININNGQWMTQKTVFITHSKVMGIHKSKISVNKSFSQRIIKVKEKIVSDTHEIVDMNTLEHGHFVKAYQDLSSELGRTINLQDDNTIKLNSYSNTLNHISVEHQKGGLRALEKLWLVNPNLRLVITLIEKKKKCVAICFSSDIRIC